jgi:phospholipase C
MGAANPKDDRMDHVVVLMFENRSFDNVLGYLYQPSEHPTFQGLAGKEFDNPVPGYAGNGPASSVSVHEATSMATPYPDPGEEYQHVNTQLFGTVLPEANRFAEIDDMAAPFNVPPPPVSQPTPMSGFVTDYVNSFKVAMDRFPTVAEYTQIMASYTPDQLPVLSSLARGFKCFDHWFCEVPSQTYPNRSFFHAASSSGFVLNSHPAGKFSLENNATTIFERLSDAGKSWRVYIDPAQILSATGLIHARRLLPRYADRFGTIFDFYADAHSGNLPNYSFIEPNMFHPHTDMHPHSGARWAEDLGLRPPDTMIGGENLLADVYNAVRQSSSSAGSSWRNTALLVTFDEHGGTFDHVSPTAAVPPDSSKPECDFAFDRLGVRIPTILVSAWLEPGTVESRVYRSTSMIASLRDWWGLGGPLTRRDADAPSLVTLLTRTSPLPPEEWPTVTPRKQGFVERAESEFLRMVEKLETPMGPLERDSLAEALSMERGARGADTAGITHGEAHEHFHRLGGTYFPNVASGRKS